MTIDTISEVRTRLAALQTNISGVTKAFTHIPQRIEDHELPCFVNRVGEGQYNVQQLGEAIVVDTRLYNMQLYVTEALSGLSEAAAEEAALAFVDPVTRYFLERPQLQLAGNAEVVYRAVLESDTGVVVGIPYPSGTSKTYAACQFSLRVFTLRHLSFQ